MMKRKRGRPRKIHSNNLDEEIVNGNDNLPEFFKIYMSALSSKLLRIPPDFIEKFGGNIPTTCTIERQPRGVSWQVELNRVNDGWFFQKGWPNFVEDNLLREGDFLTFCYHGKSLFYVKIFSPNGCEKEGASSSRLDESSPSDTYETKRKHRRRISSRWGSSVAYINGNPSFSIVLMKTHIKSRAMCIPTPFWSAHMKTIITSRKEATLWVENKAWNVGIVYYDNKVLFQKGCAQFFKDNSIKVGTSCTFQLIDPDQFSFRVTSRIDN
ncbi:putative B3 domain-containing protein Os03g0621600 isoform X2 [Salvia miltiorrhiza]|uniref:putative B3 domain-containing protein Os03g0621600 isoform X2 n=1 Tax=Salvia miltiorrhiza TaxID=226208 RepID=UPI0025AC7E91|nr:putative B3 domain-containing protein Os03g0621600 isoform X2 [Salvia miltiorrhiza]